MKKKTWKADSACTPIPNREDDEEMTRTALEGEWSPSRTHARSYKALALQREPTTFVLAQHMMTKKHLSALRKLSAISSADQERRGFQNSRFDGQKLPFEMG